MSVEKERYQKLMLSPTSILRAEPQYYGAYIIFDSKWTRTEFLKEVEFRALKYISEKVASVEEIATQVGMEYEACLRLMERMMKLKYILPLDDLSNAVYPPKKLPVNSEWYTHFLLPFLSAPSSVDIFVTNRCNLKCIHCYSNGGDGETHDLSLNDLEHIFEQLESVGVLEVRINGGEPLLHPQIAEIFLALQKRRFRKVLLTNGTNITEETATLLKEAEIIPTVSLDDSDEEEHDRFRGVKGSFKRTIEALTILQKKRVQYGINCCLHRNNLHRSRDIIDLAVAQGASRIAFLDLKNMGRLKKHEQWFPSYGEYEKIRRELEFVKFKSRQKIDVSLDVFLHCQPLRESKLEAQKGYISCQAGKNRLSIDSDGSVYPCNLVLSDPMWRFGNIKNEDILGIWFSQKWSIFRGDMRINDLPHCKTCKNLKKCSDFYCRLLPYITTGDLYNSHPRCNKGSNQL